MIAIADDVLQALREPGVAPRAALVLSGVVGIGALAAIAPGVLPRSGRYRAALLAAGHGGFAYLLLGTVLRFVVQHHRSRLQILVLLGVVAVVEAFRYRRGREATSLATWLAGSAGVCVGVVAAKWALEPGVLTETWTRLRWRVSGA